MSHERDVTPARPLVLGLGAIAVLLALSVAIPSWLETTLVKRRERLGPPANPLTAEFGRTVPPAPRLQVTPKRDIASLRAAEASTLESYGWVDRKAGIARIPIERAMEIIAEAKP